jgi:Ca-activated chloride channel family protein
MTANRLDCPEVAMRRLRLAPLAAALALLGLLLPMAAPVWADGIIIDPPPPCPTEGPCPPERPLFPLAVQYHHVTVTIDNQVATTHVDQLFRNDFDFTVEGTYMFPIPAEAAVSDFAMWVDGQRLQGQVLSAEEARTIYDDIVRRTLDPALLEYAGRGAVQATIFPIPPGETRRVELEYSQVLPADNGLIHYRYPLNTEKFSTTPLEQVSVSVQVVSREAVRAIYSPSHNVAVARDGEFEFTAGYEANNVVPDTDFDLYYSVSPDDIGVNTLTYRDPATGEGFFVLLAAPSLDVDRSRVVAKDVVVVLDQSGSMEGEKFAQAQNALEYVLGHLNAEDRFNLIAFSTGTRAYQTGLQPARDAAEARPWVRSLRAEGGTNINLALLEALAQLSAGSERPAIVLFLTDGLATEGEVDTTRILDNIGQAAPDNVRLFAFGVGDDVDTVLLDTLVEQHHGASSYVRPGEDVNEAVSGFYGKVSTPVLADLQLDFDNIVVEDLYPETLPDLFAGSQLVITGHYRGSGPATLRLSGTVNGQTQSFTYPDQNFRSAGGSDFIPRLWATRRIGYLLNQVRLHGENPELIDAIVKLSVRYGIVTPYTSYLVTEDGTNLLTEEGRSALSDEVYAAAAAATEAVSGEAAVDAAQDQSALAGAGAPAPVAGEAAEVVRIVGDRTFLFTEGVWVDTAFDPSRLQAQAVSFASDAYFELLAARPELRGAFALGPRVIALAADGSPWEVVEGDAPAINVPPTYTPVVVAQVTPAVGEPSATPAPVGTLPPGATAVPTSVIGDPVPARTLAAIAVPVVIVALAAAGIAAAVMMARRK